MSENTGRSVEALRSLLEPRSIAVVGATERPNYGGRLLRNLIQSGYAGAIYPINPRHEQVQGRKAYRDVRDLPEPADLAVIVVPANDVAETLRGCGERGVLAASVITAGFAERGGDGIRMQAALLDAARKAGVRFTGPNSLGIANFHRRVVCHSAPRWEAVPIVPGPLAIVSQSGALAFTSLIARIAEAGVGMSKIISVGNQADLTVVELIEYLVEHDDATRVVTVYLEGLPEGEGRRLMAVGRRAAERNKAVVLLKVGRSQAGVDAVAAHTAALAGDDLVYDAAMQQAGIVRVTDLDDMWAVGDFLAHLPQLDFKKGVGLLTNSGGLSGHLADLCGVKGVPLAPIIESTQQAIATKLNGRGAAGNPADISGQIIVTHPDGVLHGNEAVVDYIKYMAADPGVGLTVLGITTPAAGLSSIEVASNIINARGATSKPLAVLWHSGTQVNDVPGPENCGMLGLRAAGVPVFEEPARCAEVIAQVRNRQIALGRPLTIAEVPVDATVPVEVGRSPRQQFAMLQASGIPVARMELVSDLAGARSVAEQMGYPVAMKVFSDALVHKSDRGGVKAPVSHQGELDAAFAELAQLGRQLGSYAIGIQEFVAGGTEMFVSTARDPIFGPVVMLGLGGIWVEVFRDVAMRVGPIDEREAEVMLGELKGGSLLRGARGRTKADVSALCSALSRLSAVLFKPGVEAARIIELNPLIVLPAGSGVRAVDVRVVWDKTN